MIVHFVQIPAVEMRVLRKKRGSVLVMVLWVLTLLTMIVSYYSSQVRIMHNASSYLFNTTKGRMAAFSVLSMVARHMTESEENATSLNESLTIVPNTKYSTYVGKTRVDFVVENESGKIDLNQVKEEFLRGFMRFLIGEKNPRKADTLTDGILDWRDNDKLTRTNGAEDNVYNDKDPPYYAANSVFRSVEELRLINGVTDKLFYGPIEGTDTIEGWSGGLMDLFTVYGTPNVNPKFAPLPLKSYMEENSIEGENEISPVWLLVAWIGHKTYKIYFTKINNDPWYSTQFFTQGLTN